MVKIITLVSLLLVGCSPCGLWDLPEAGLRPEITDTFNNPGLDVEAQWKDLVAQQMELWNTALVEAGCNAPFHFAAEGEEAYPVKLWTQADWPHDDKLVGATTNGPLGTGRIDVLTRGPFFEANMATLAHEFGHALNLEHVPEGSDSVMTPKVGDLLGPTARDIQAVCPH